ncbi:hypothetical protein ACH5RR_002514 [Cinchona calisaya]|uniref:SIS domain-containing protein n=1 Tax=Cinchona calisaya TaxID=153742 RepID=A0ABD3B7A6_9GENT
MHFYDVDTLSEELKSHWLEMEVVVVGNLKESFYDLLIDIFSIFKLEIISLLYDKVKEVLKLDQEMKDHAELLINGQSLLVFGRGYNYATALEVDHNLPIVVIASCDARFSKQQSVIQQLHAWTGRLVVMCSEGDSTSVSVGGSWQVIEALMLRIVSSL